MANMKSIISPHNKHVFSNFNSPTHEPDTCNCREKKQIVHSKENASI